MAIEYDVTSDAWEIYQKLYNNNIENWENSNTLNKRPFINTVFKYKGQKSMKLDFSGETDFNFGDKKIWGLGRSHYSHFKKMLEDYPEGTEILDECKSFYHSERNISLMPKTGNLQSVKKSVGNDRLDVFIWCLNEYYLQRNNFIFNHCSYENLKPLKSFLNLFHNIYEYCEVIYHIDVNLTHDLIISGGKAINSPERVMDYMNLARSFWTQKNNYIKSTPSSPSIGFSN